MPEPTALGWALVPPVIEIQNYTDPFPCPVCHGHKNEGDEEVRLDAVLGVTTEKPATPCGLCKGKGVVRCLPVE